MSASAGRAAKAAAYQAGGGVGRPYSWHTWASSSSSFKVGLPAVRALEEVPEQPLASRSEHAFCRFGLLLQVRAVGIKGPESKSKARRTAVRTSIKGGRSGAAPRG